VTGGQQPDSRTVVVRRPEWVAHVLDESSGEPHAVLLHLPRGERTALSPTATRVWQLVVAAGAAGVRTGDLVPILAAEYEADPMIISQDVAALVAQLLAGAWVEEVPVSDGGTALQTDGGERE
jgi:hypothetical protein